MQLNIQGPLFINKNFKRVTAEQVHRPSKCDTLSDCTNHIPMKLALGRDRDEREKEKEVSILMSLKIILYLLLYMLLFVNQSYFKMVYF